MLKLKKKLKTLQATGLSFPRKNISTSVQTRDT